MSDVDTDLDTDDPAPLSFGRVVENGFSTVLVPALARIAWRPKSWPPSLLRAVPSAAIVACGPGFAELLLLWLAPSYALHTPRAISWVVSLIVVNVFALLGGWRTWALLQRAASDVEELLSTSSRPEKVTQWLQRAICPRAQMAWSLLCSAAACSLLGFTEPAIRPALELGFISYLSVAWSGFIWGNCVYWGFALSELGRRILRRADLAVVWHSPASTPGIYRLSEMYAFLTLMVLMAYLVVQLLNLRASQYGSSQVLNALQTAIPVGAAFAALATGLLPHVWLYRLVREARFTAMRVLRSYAGDTPPASGAEATKIHTMVELYRLVESSPGLPFSTASMVQYGAAILGTLLAYLLGK